MGPAWRIAVPPVSVLRNVRREITARLQSGPCYSLMYHNQELCSSRRAHLLACVAVLSVLASPVTLAQSPPQHLPGPAYRIQASLDLAAHTLRGSAVVEWIPAPAGEARVCLRLDDPTLTIQSARLSTAATDGIDLVADARLSPIAGPQSRLARMSRALALEPGSTARVQMTWERGLPRADRVGTGESLLVAGWFPKLAADCDADRHESRVPASTLHATITVPRGWTVVSGARESESDSADGTDSQRYELELENASELAWAATRGLEISVDRFQPAGASAVTLRTVLAPGSAERSARILTGAKDALRVLSQWYGHSPASQLTVVEVGWNSLDARAAFPGLMASAARWLTTSRDVSLERTVVAGVNRQFWFEAADQTGRAEWFAEGLARYAGARALNAVLEGRDYPTLRFFGDAIAYTTRSILLSRAPSDPRPRVSGLEELEAPAAPWRGSSATTGAEAERAVRAMDTLERYIGWPAIREALAAGQDDPTLLTPSGFASRLSAARGNDLSWFFREAFRVSARFDYGIEAFPSDVVKVAPR